MHPYALAWVTQKAESEAKLYVLLLYKRVQSQREDERGREERRDSTGWVLNWAPLRIKHYWLLHLMEPSWLF